MRRTARAHAILIYLLDRSARVSCKEGSSKWRWSVRRLRCVWDVPGGGGSPRWELVTSDHLPLRNVPAAVGRISAFHGAASPVGCYTTCMCDLYTWLLLLDCAVAAHVHSQQLGLCLDETPLQGRSKWTIGFASISWRKADGNLGGGGAHSRAVFAWCVHPAGCIASPEGRRTLSGYPTERGGAKRSAQRFCSLFCWVFVSGPRLCA